MIKAEELRIGNYIRNDGQNLRVTEISAIMVVCDNWGFDNLEEIQGIPLTPEILEKCGFVADDQDNSIYYLPTENNLFWLIIIGDIISHEDVVLQYLHQLQNLFYALVGQELTINL